jgi:hypothetical protein
MRDKMDVYIQRRLKNWAAANQPAADGRKQLLKSVVVLDSPSNQASLWQLWAKYRSPRNRTTYVYQDYQFQIPFTQSKYWSYHLATSIRLAMI